MADRNWEQELAKIDKQLASVSDDQLLAQTRAERAGVTVPAGGKVPAAAPAKGAMKMASADAAPTRGSWVAWAQLVVAIAAATGLWFWPWPTRCGLNAVAFTGATGIVTALGLWSAIGSWRHRQSKAHVLSFAVMIWGLVLGAREVLPRVGYAIGTPERPNGWSCSALPLPAPTPTTNAPAPKTTAPNAPAQKSPVPSEAAPTGTQPGGTPPASTPRVGPPPTSARPAGISSKART